MRASTSRRQRLGLGLSLVLALLPAVVGWSASPASAVVDGEYVYTSEFGQSGSEMGQLHQPRAVDVGPDGSLWVADLNAVTRFAPDGTMLARFTTGLSGPADVAVTPDGAVYVANEASGRVQRLEPTGSLGVAWGGKGTANGQFSGLTGIWVDEEGLVYTADELRVQVFTAQGQFVRSFAPTRGDNSFALLDVAVTPGGVAYVLNLSGIDVYSPTGTRTGRIFSPWSEAKHLDVLGEDVVLAAGAGDDPRVVVLRQDGSLVQRFGVSGLAPGLLAAPWAAAVGTGGRIHVADAQRDKVLTYTRSAAPAAPGPSQLAALTLGAAYDQQLTSAGYPAPTFSLASGSLPPGLALSSAGRITGTPTTPGAYPVTVRATNSVGSATTDYTLSVPTRPFSAVPLVTVGASPKVGRPLAADLTGAFVPAATLAHQWLRDGAAIAGATASTYTPTADDLGHQLSVRVVGTRPVYTTTTVTSDAVGPVGGSVEADTRFTVTVDPSGTHLLGSTVTARVTGLAARESWTMTLGGAQVAAGRADAEGAASRTVLLDTPGAPLLKVTGESAGRSGETALVVVTPAAPSQPSPSTLPAPALGQDYAAQLVSTGVPEPTFSVTGALPPGLSLSPSGALTGTPTAAGSWSFVVVATNSQGSSSREYALEVPRLPFGTHAVTVTGLPEVGRELAADHVGTPPPGTVVSWRWLRDGSPVEGATGPSYVPTAEDLGGQLSARATLRHPDREQTSVASPAVGPVGSSTAAPASLTVTAPPGPRLAGGSVPVQVRGLGAFETWTLRVGGTIVAAGRTTLAGTVARTVALPRGARGVVPVTVTGAAADRTGTLAVTAAAPTARLGVVLPTTARRVRPGARVRVVVTGLVAGESVRVTDRGRLVASGTASGSGTWTGRWVARKPLGRHAVVVVGLAPGRTGAAAYRVARRGR